MKTILAVWIIIQLLVIGLAGGEAMYKMREGTFECKVESAPSKFTYMFVGAFYPIVFFTNDDFIKDYCDNLDIKK